MADSLGRLHVARHLWSLMYHRRHPDVSKHVLGAIRLNDEGEKDGGGGRTERIENGPGRTDASSMASVLKCPLRASRFVQDYFLAFASIYCRSCHPSGRDDDGNAEKAAHHLKALANVRRASLRTDEAVLSAVTLAFRRLRVINFLVRELRTDVDENRSPVRLSTTTTRVEEASGRDGVADDEAEDDEDDDDMCLSVWSASSESDDESSKVPRLALRSRVVDNEENGVRINDHHSEFMSHVESCSLSWREANRGPRAKRVRGTEDNLLCTDDRLRSFALQLVLDLLVHPCDTHIDMFMSGTRRTTFMRLRGHLECRSNQSILRALTSKASNLRDGPRRLLRLLCCDLLKDESNYVRHDRIARGAYGDVYVCGPNKRFAVKMLARATEKHERDMLLNAFTEISVMSSLSARYASLDVTTTSSSSPPFCRLMDFGATRDGHYVLIMERCKCDLRTWRTSSSSAPTIVSHPKMLLRIFVHVADAVATLHACGVVHHDLKCANVLLREIPSVANGGAIDLCIADFGESTASDSDEIRPRGTECVRSPEQLVLDARAGTDTTTTRPSFATDVWSLGCLLYELLVGDYLFRDASSDWAAFFTRLTATSSSYEDYVRREQTSALHRILGDLASDAIEALLRKSLTYEPHQRDSAMSLRDAARKLLTDSA